MFDNFHYYELFTNYYCMRKISTLEPIYFVRCADCGQSACGPGSAEYFGSADGVRIFHIDEKLRTRTDADPNP